MRIGLVLEGGGMRGVYTGGVLESFMENELYFPYTIGVSAGACNAVSYLTRQKGRNRRVTIDYVNSDYISIRNWIRRGSIFGMDYIFRKIPDELDLLDYDTLFSIGETFVIGTTDPETGKPAYYSNEIWARNRESIKSILTASSSLPFFAPPVLVEGQWRFDGGVTDPIPVQKALEDGCTRIVAVLTKDASYRIKPFKHAWLARRMYRRFPRLVEAMERREWVYNETLSFLQQLEAEGRAFIVRPTMVLPVGRMERNKELLIKLYELGEKDAESALPKLTNWMNKK